MGFNYLKTTATLRRQFRAFIISYVNNDMFEADLFFLDTNDSCLLYQHTMSKKLGENLNNKLLLLVRLKGGRTFQKLSHWKGGFETFYQKW